MNWKLIVKKPSEDIPDYNYDVWKELLSEEGFRQCVYCSLDENIGGGIKYFEIEHYKPKSKFAALAKEYSNLFYACAICNGFKGNDWNDVDTLNLSLAMYPNPSVTDYSTLFTVDLNSGYISGKHTASIYVLTRLYLNRPQLILYRKYMIATARYRALKSVIDSQVDELIQRAKAGSRISLDLLGEVLQRTRKLEDYKDTIMDRTRLYSLQQIRKP